MDKDRAAFMRKMHLFLAVLLGALLDSTVYAQRTATAVATVVNGFVVAVTVTDGGSGYASVPIVIISGGGGTGATAFATMINGAVNTVIVNNAGIGYTSVPTVIISAPVQVEQMAKVAFLTNDLLAYFPFDGNANDATANGVDLTSSNARQTVDRFGRANATYLFEPDQLAYLGSRREITFPSNAPMTISLWFRYDERERIPNREESLLAITDPASDKQSLHVVVETETSTLNVDFLNGLSAGRFVSYEDGPVKLRDGRWHHFSFALDGVRLKATFDGKAVVWARRPNPGFTFSAIKGKIYVGGFRGYFNGLIDDLRIYRRALSEQETQHLYRIESRPFPQIEVSRAIGHTLQLDFILQRGSKYHLESSRDFESWTPHNLAFQATSQVLTQLVEVQGPNLFWRLRQTP
jgi:hypothetical protein